MPEIQTFYAKLQKSFIHLFMGQQCQRDIVAVVEALEKEKPIAGLMQSPRGSFSTIFLPFHAEDTLFQTIAKKYTLHPKFLHFCALAGEIEAITDTMGIAAEEPSVENKAKLLPLLREFLAIFPSAEEFESWLK